MEDLEERLRQVESKQKQQWAKHENDMNSVIKHIINVIGLGTLLSYVWEIVWDELTRSA